MIQSWDACTHLYTLSKHAHRNSESYTVIPLQFKKDRVNWKKKKFPSQANKTQTHRADRCPRIAAKLHLFCAGTRWETYESQSYQHRNQGLFLCFIITANKTKYNASPSESKAVWHMGRPHRASLHSTARTEAQHAVTKKLPRWYLRHCNSHSGPDRHVPWRVSRNSVTSSRGFKPFDGTQWPQQGGSSFIYTAKNHGRFLLARLNVTSVQRNMQSHFTDHLKKKMSVFLALTHPLPQLWRI